MINIQATIKKNQFVLKGAFDKASLNKSIVKKDKVITEFVNKHQAFIYLGKDTEFKIETLQEVVKKIASLNTRDFQIDVKSFATKKVSEESVVKTFVEFEEFVNAKIYNVKTNKKAKKAKLSLVNVSAKGKKVYKEAKILADARTYTRNLQVTPPNILHSEKYASIVKKDFAQYKNISVKVLNKKQVTDLKMGLLLSVNLGSQYEPRVVILEYKGDPKSKEKTALVGKGVTFDAGGYNIKTGSYMLGMKYDMSGSAIVAGAMKAIAQIKPKSNVVGVLMLTDNMINAKASTPDSVFTGMNGKTVEINNTDAEGRLALADGLTYSVKKLKATRLVDVATLTGAVIVALGSTYSGAWSTTEKGWKDLEKAAKNANELVWRMPLHPDFIKFMKRSDVADLKNTALDGKGGSSTAAMFLSNFTEGKEFIHLDVAGTADISHKPQGVMVKTLVELVK